MVNNTHSERDSFFAEAARIITYKCVCIINLRSPAMMCSQRQTGGAPLYDEVYSGALANSRGPLASVAAGVLEVGGRE